MTLLHRLSDSAGQSLIEFALVLPLCLAISFGVAEVGNALLDSHTVTRLTREGSNLISRNTSIDDAVTAMQSMSNGQVDFSTDSKLIFSVIKRGPTIGSVNYDTQVLYQRYEFGALAESSRISTAGGGSFGPGPNYVAANSDSDTSLRITNLPPNLVTVPGGLIYVTEIFSTHPRITPLDRLGVSVPEMLYSVAYF